LALTIALSSAHFGDRYVRVGGAFKIVFCTMAGERFGDDELPITHEEG
jgi:hypothetical protein